MDDLQRDSVSKMEWQGMKEKWWIFFSPFILLGYIFFCFKTARPIEPFVLFVLILPFILVVSYVHQKALEAFMRAFATRHGFSYTKIDDPSTLHGKLFSVGYSKTMRHVVQGFLEDPLSLFLYGYTVGSGKNSVHYAHTVASCSYKETTFPSLVLSARSQRKYGTQDLFGVVHDREVTLEPEFSQVFSLVVTEGFETEALQIFSPEILRELVKMGAEYRLEFCEHSWYLSVDKYLTTSEELEKFFATASYLAKTLGPLLHRLHDDFSAMHAYIKE
jgi:hypothetical protein